MKKLILGCCVGVGMLATPAQAGLWDELFHPAHKIVRETTAAGQPLPSSCPETKAQKAARIKRTDDLQAKRRAEEKRIKLERDALKPTLRERFKRVFQEDVKPILISIGKGAVNFLTSLGILAGGGVAFIGCCALFTINPFAGAILGSIVLVGTGYVLDGFMDSGGWWGSI